MFGSFFFFFFSKPRETTSFHTFFFKKKSVATAIYRSVRKYRFRSFNFHWLYRTKVRLPFALRSPASSQSVSPTSGVATSAPVSLVGSDSGLHNPNHKYPWPTATLLNPKKKKKTTTIDYGHMKGVV